MKTSKKLLTLMLALSSISAMAVTQRVDLDLNGVVVRAGDVLPLKRLINREIDHRSIEGWNLNKVSVQAKSNYGEAELSLSVAHRETPFKVVPGTPENFSSDYSGYYNLVFHAPLLRSRARDTGRIQLYSTGLIKLDEISVLFEKQLDYDYTDTRGLDFQREIEFKAGKVLGSGKSISVRGMISAIELETTREKVYVDSVVIHYADGTKIILDEVRGKLRTGQKVAFVLDRELYKRVRSITVNATSTKLFGGRGKLAVSIAR